MDNDLDRALASARPPTAARTPGLIGALEDLIAATEVDSRSKRLRRRRLVLAWIAAIVLPVVGATTAQAVGLLPQPFDGRSWDNDPAAVRMEVTLPSGDTCRAVYMVVPVESRASAHEGDDWRAVWGAATAFLESVDPASLSTPQVLSRYREAAESAHQRSAGSQPEGEVPPAPSEREVRVQAPGAELKARLDSRLRELGLPTDMLVMTIGDTCAPEIVE